MTHHRNESFLTAEYLRSILDYDRNTGDLTWRYRIDAPKHWNTRFAGKKAGCIGKKYVHIAINELSFYAHRIIWCHQTGSFPAIDVDHRNLIGTQNHWDNLRESTKEGNSHNKAKFKSNTSGYKGVFFYKRSQRWYSMIAVNGKRTYLGSFDSPEEAHIAYQKAAADLHGDFARAA